MSTVYVGIDNGISGALGIVEGGDDAPARLLPTPVRSELNYQKAGKNVTRLDYRAFINILSCLKELYGENIRVVLEKPFVNPANFVATATSLRCLEAQLIALEELGISRQYLDAKAWQKEFLPEVKGRAELKKASREVGLRMYPNLSAEIKKQKDADALFIALYAKRYQL